MSNFAAELCWLEAETLSTRTKQAKVDMVGYMVNFIPPGVRMPDELSSNNSKLD